MQAIRNTTNAPLRISLPGGKVLHLGPGKSAQIDDKATEHPSVKRLVEAGSIEVLGEGARVQGVAGSGTAAEQTYGRAKSSFRRRQGER
jgi:hypothetical protein